MILWREMIGLAEMNPVLDALFARRSIRRYKDEKVKDDDLKMILNAAASAPTAGNLQNYSIIVIKNPAKKDKLFELSGRQRWVRAADILLVFVVDAYRHKRWCELRGADYNLGNYFTILWGMTDAVAAAENAVIAAQSLGLGTVYIGTIFGEMQGIIDLLKLPVGTYPVAMLCLGVPNETPEARDRIPMEALVHWDEFHDYTDEILNDAFAKREEAFAGSAKAKGDAGNLAQYITKKRFTREKMLNRAKSTMQALIDQGFWDEAHLSE